MVQIGQIVVHLTIQPLSVLLNIWCPVHHTGEKTMVQMGQIVVHITTHPLPVLLIIRCPCTPYRGENYGTNRSDCHTSHNTASDSLAYYLVPLYTIQGRKLWYKWVRLSYISQHILCQSCLLSGAPVHHTGEKTMVQIGQIVIHLTIQPLTVLLIIWCPCTPYRGRNYGTNRSDCHTSHNTASASLAYYLVPLYTIQGRKLWYK